MSDFEWIVEKGAAYPKERREMSGDLIARLERNAHFYASEAKALAEKPDRRDNRHLGSQEAKTIAELMNEAVAALTSTEREQPK